VQTHAYTRAIRRVTIVRQMDFTDDAIHGSYRPTDERIRAQQYRTLVIIVLPLQRTALNT